MKILPVQIKNVRIGWFGQTFTIMDRSIVRGGGDPLYYMDSSTAHKIALAAKPIFSSIDLPRGFEVEFRYSDVYRTKSLSYCFINKCGISIGCQVIDRKTALKIIKKMRW